MKNIINSKQLEAIHSGNEPMMIIAGAGSGKTFVLTKRIIYLISELGYHHNSILAFTFTNKAANEIRGRIMDFIPNIPFNWIGTFHSICLKILREDINVIERTNDFIIIDEDDQLSIIKEIYAINGFNKDIIKPNKTHAFISYLKSKKIDKDNFEEINSELSNIDLLKDKMDIISKSYNQYCNYLINKNLLDFDDLIIYTNKIFQTSEEVRKKWQNRFNYILVDEFQDTNEEQFVLLKYLIKDNENIFIVGDPDQMIYSWRGAYSNIFEDFQILFDNHKKILLEKNYRSSKNILSISNQLISNNKFRIEKNLFTDNSQGSNIIYFHANNSDKESNWIANKIIMLKNVGYSYKDMLILYRSNYLSRNIEQSLMYKNIPYVIFGGLKFFQRKEIKDIIAFLKLICFDDDVSLIRIYNIPKRKISEATYSKILMFSTENNISTWEGFQRVKEILDLKELSIKSCEEFVNLIMNLKSFKFVTINDLIEKIIIDTKYTDYINENDESFRIDNIKELKSAINIYQYNNPKSTLSDYLQEITLYTSNEEKNIDYKNKDFVSLMTVHNAKGLEFKNVFIISFNDGLFPATKSIESGDISEERRIAYVAMTRAKDNLFITSYNGKNFHSKSSTNLLPSRFINEISSNRSFEYLVDPSIKTISDKQFFWSNTNIGENEKSIAENFHNEKQSFDLGDAIFHTVFGEGIIIGIENDTLKITFKSPYGNKFISRNHKSIKKLIPN